MQIIGKGEWLEIVKHHGFEYAHEIRGTKAVAVLGVDKNDRYRVLVRYEMNPAKGSLELSMASLTGGVEEGESPRKAAMRELREEAGIKKSPKDFQLLGAPVWGFKMSDTKYWMYVVMLEGTESGLGLGDGTSGESGAYCTWMSIEDAINGSGDTVLSAICGRWIMALLSGKA